MNTTTRRPLLHAAVCLLVLSSGCGSDEDTEPPDRCPGSRRTPCNYQHVPVWVGGLAGA